MYKRTSLVGLLLLVAAGCSGSVTDGSTNASTIRPLTDCIDDFDACLTNAASPEECEPLLDACDQPPPPQPRVE